MKHLFNSLAKDFFIIILCHFNSCTNTDGKIILDQRTSFKIPENSSLSRIMPSDVDYFHRLTFPIPFNSLVLYKVISSADYQLYIGVALGTTTDSIKLGLLNHSTVKIISQKSLSQGSDAIFLQLDSVRFCYHYLKQLKQGDKYLFSVTTKDRMLAENMYNSDFIGKYFVNELDN